MTNVKRDVKTIKTINIRTQSDDNLKRSASFIFVYLVKLYITLSARTSLTLLSVVRLHWRQKGTYYINTENVFKPNYCNSCTNKCRCFRLFGKMFKFLWCTREIDKWNAISFKRV